MLLVVLGTLCIAVCDGLVFSHHLLRSSPGHFVADVQRWPNYAVSKESQQSTNYAVSKDSRRSLRMAVSDKVFMDWAESNGVACDALSLSSYDGVRGIGSRDGNKKGDLLVAVPDSLVLRVVGGRSDLPITLVDYVSEQVAFLLFFFAASIFLIPTSLLDHDPLAGWSWVLASRCGTGRTGGGSLH